MHLATTAVWSEHVTPAAVWSEHVTAAAGTPGRPIGPLVAVGLFALALGLLIGVLLGARILRGVEDVAVRVDPWDDPPLAEDNDLVQPDGLDWSDPLPCFVTHGGRLIVPNGSEALAAMMGDTFHARLDHRSGLTSPQLAEPGLYQPVD